MLTLRPIVTTHSFNNDNTEHNKTDSYKKNKCSEYKCKSATNTKLHNSSIGQHVKYRELPNVNER